MSWLLVPFVLSLLPFFSQMAAFEEIREPLLMRELEESLARFEADFPEFA